MELDYYTAVLYKQFCETRGYDCNFKEVINGLCDVKILSEFKNWILGIQNKEYYEFLNYLGYHNLDGAIEVNQGKYDTISEEKDIVTVSPFNYTLGKKNSRLHIVDGIVIVEMKNKLVLPEGQRVLITHNPYDDSVLKWPMIEKRGEHNISIGFYGLTSDENYKDRVELAKFLLKRMDDNCQFDYEIDQDKYFISLNSKHKI